MKEFKLGDKVYVRKYYQRNGRKPKINFTNMDRYNLVGLDKEGVWCGKRRIYTKGYTFYEYEEGYQFSPIDYEVVHLVAISIQHLAYVPDKFIDRGKSCA